MPPFPGPLPPTLTGGPQNAGPAVAPHGNPGNATQGMGDIKTALDALQKALPSIPMGTELHKTVLDAVAKIGKHMSEAQNNPQMKLQNLMQMIAQLKAQQPNAALAGLAGGAPGGQPPAPPALMPPPGGAPPGQQMAA